MGQTIPWLLMLCFASCTTYRSTLYQAQPDGHVVPTSHCGQPGVPVAVKVPTHLDLFVEERYYLLPDQGVYREAEILDANGQPVRARSIRAELVETKQIFLVDFKRAAAGISQSGLKFNADQGLQEVSGKIQDETVRDATAAVKALTPLLLARPTAAGETTALESKGLVGGSRVIAYARVPLQAEDFEQQVADFAAAHLDVPDGSEVCAVAATAKPARSAARGEDRPSEIP